MAGGWQGSTRRDRLPLDWKRRRARILARDEHRCTWVTEQGRCPEIATEVDHVVRGDDHREDNLASLCSYHHGVKTSAEGRAARAQRPRFSERHPSERHPGLR